MDKQKWESLSKKRYALGVEAKEKGPLYQLITTGG